MAKRKTPEKTPKTVRFDPDQAARISLIQEQMRGGFAGALRLVIQKGLEGLDARPISEPAVREQEAAYGAGPPIVSTPLVEEDVAAVVNAVAAQVAKRSAEAVA
jgi:hypothetical protein